MVKKVVITGSRGQLGRSLLKNIPRQINNSKELLFWNKSDFNLLKIKDCINKIKEVKPSWLINCAAYTNVDKSEKEFDQSIFINGLALKDISIVLKEIDCKIIQISTDYVFDGRQSFPYETNHNRNPLNKYGEGKALGEKFVEEILFPVNSSKIVRTSWLMSEFGNNFAKTIFELYKSKSQLRIISDQVGAFTSGDTLSNFIWNIILKEEEGITTPNILHCVNSGICSWFDIAVAIGEFAENNAIIKKRASLIPIKSIDYKCDAKRPFYSVLDCMDNRELLPKTNIYWRDALKIIIKNLSYSK